jgi:hypothetical protein
MDILGMIAGGQNWNELKDSNRIGIWTHGMGKDTQNWNKNYLSYIGSSLSPPRGLKKPTT